MIDMREYIDKRKQQELQKQAQKLKTENESDSSQSSQSSNSSSSSGSSKSSKPSKSPKSSTTSSSASSNSSRNGQPKQKRGRPKKQNQDKFIIEEWAENWKECNYELFTNLILKKLQNGRRKGYKPEEVILRVKQNWQDIKRKYRRYQCRPCQQTFIDRKALVRHQIKNCTMIRIDTRPKKENKKESLHLKYKYLDYQQFNKDLQYDFPP